MINCRGTLTVISGIDPSFRRFRAAVGIGRANITSVLDELMGKRAGRGPPGGDYGGRIGR